MNGVLAETFPAGEILAEELEERGWTQAEFAEILGRPPQFVSEIITGKKEITRESASQIAAALNTSAEFWLNLQDSYYLWRQAQDRHSQDVLSDVRLRARLKDLAPIGVLLRRGLIRGETPRLQEQELKRLYKIDDIYDEPEIFAAARRSKPDESVSTTQLAWTACVRQKAEAAQAETYSHKGLADLAGGLTGMVRTAGDFAKLPELFAAVGVRLVYVEAFPSSKMDGCSLLIKDDSPAIGISGRGRRLDKVLFTLLHEVAHVVLGHLKKQPYIVDDQGQRPTLGLEEPTDDRAASWVLPKDLPPIPERVSAGWVTAVAEEQGIHPIVLIGRLQNDGRIPWRTTLVKNAPTVTSYLEAW